MAGPLLSKPARLILRRSRGQRSWRVFTGAKARSGCVRRTNASDCVGTSCTLCLITVIGRTTMNNSFARSIWHPLMRLFWVCTLVLTGGVLSGGAAAQHLDNGILVLNYFPDTGQFRINGVQNKWGHNRINGVRQINGVTNKWGQTRVNQLFHESTITPRLQAVLSINPTLRKSLVSPMQLCFYVRAAIF